MTKHSNMNGAAIPNGAASPTSPAAATGPVPTTTNVWYDGSLRLTQPSRHYGFRATSDAVLLATSIPPTARYIWEFGIGTGAAALIVLKRLPKAEIIGIDCEAMLLDLARYNAEENGFHDRLALIHADLVTSRFSLADSPKKDYAPDHIMMNPPYNDPASTPPAHREVEVAKTGDFSPGWIAAAASALKTKGEVTVISRAGYLVPLLASLSSNDFGECVVRPIHPMRTRPANRVLVRARKGLRGGVTLLPPLLCDSEEYEGLAQGGHISLVAPGRKQSQH